MNEFRNDIPNRPLEPGPQPDLALSEGTANKITIAAAAFFAALIVALVMFAPGNKDGSQVATNDTRASSAPTTPMPRPAMPLSQPSARDATPAPTQPANSGQTPSPAAQ